MSSIACASGTSGASCASTSPTGSSPIRSIRLAARFLSRSTAPQRWCELVHAIETEHTTGEHRPLTLALAWIEIYGARIEAQTATRDPTAPHSTGPVEKLIDVELDRRIGHRVGSFTNRTRLAKLLNLITLDITGKADGRQWADRLRERLYLAGGRPNNQRPHDDPKGVYSLIY